MENVTLENRRLAIIRHPFLSLWASIPSSLSDGSVISGKPPDCPQRAFGNCHLLY